MIKKILAIAGKPGLFRLVSKGKNMFIVESLLTNKRMPAYAHDKIISLADISIYTTEGDVPLAQVLQAVCDKAEAKTVDVKALGDDQAIRDYFAEVLPAFDRDRVYTTDIKKLFSWYNILINSGWDKFVDDQPEEEAKAEE